MANNDVVGHVAREAGVGVAVVKATPPVVATGAVLVGFPLQDWVLAVTLLYTVVQIIVILPHAIRVLRGLWGERRKS